MNTEVDDKHNKGLTQITTDLYRLRTIEHSSRSMGSKYGKAKPLFDKVTKVLLAKKNFVLYRPMWEELHDRMVYYYDYRNKTNLSKKMPLFSGTLHNEAVGWWLKLKRKGHLSDTLLHFDTHDDMGIPSTKQHLLNNKNKLDYNKVIAGSCGLIYWPVTCLLLSEGVDNVVWCMPSWVYDSNYTNQEQALVHYKKGDEFVYIRPKKSKKDDFLIEGDVRLLPAIGKTKEMDFYQPHEFSRLKVSTSREWKLLSNLIGDKSRFILDVDLDFFVTNGDKFSKKEYQEDFGDIESTGRVHAIPGITEPRAAYADSNSSVVVSDLNTEFGLVKKRVDVFLRGLAYLKKKGKRPCCITLSDSAPSFFSGSTSRAVWTNSYTPKYFVPALRYLLMKGLKRLYNM